MYSKSLFLLLIFQLFFTQISSAQLSNNRFIDQFLSTDGMEHASIGLCVKDFSGQVIAQHNMSQSLVPASTLKLVTTASAFEILGANFQYETLLAKDKNKPNRLLILGSGDPSLGSEHLNDNPSSFLYTWIEEIIKAFPGDKELEIMVVDNLFGYQGVSRKWLREDLGNYYAAGAYGISIFDNTYRLSFNTENSSSAPQILETKPYMKDIQFTNTLSLNTENKDNGYIVGEPFSNKRVIIGDIPANRKKFTIKGDIPNPGLFLVETISDLLAEKGIKVKSGNTTYDTFHKEMYANNRTQYSCEVFYVHKSPSLAAIARVINEKSNNHYTEHLIRTIGRAKNSDIYSLSLEVGIEKIKEEWSRLGLEPDALFMYDGCGLTPSNAINAELMCNILRYMQVEGKNALPFINSLPKAGKEGTVRNLLKGTRLEGKVYVKSGSIANVQAFGGYYIEGDKKYVFSIMVNNYHCPRRDVVKAIEDLLLNILK